MRAADRLLQGPSFAFLYSILAGVSGLLLPVFLIPIVFVTGYSEVFEELAKALVILFLVLKGLSAQTRIGLALFFGFCFGFSENILYLNQIFQLGDFSVFWQRMLFTLPMHIVTVLIMTLAALAGKKYLFFGFVGAVVLHALFNSLVAHPLFPF